MKTTVFPAEWFCAVLRRAAPFFIFLIFSLLLVVFVKAAQLPSSDLIYMKLDFPDDCPKQFNGLTYAFDPSSTVTVSLAGSQTDVKIGDVASLTYDPQAHNCVLVLASGKNVTVQLKDTSFMQYSKCIYAHLFGTEVGVESIHGYKNFAFHMSVISKPTETPEIVPPSAKGLFVRLSDNAGNTTPL